MSEPDRAQARLLWDYLRLPVRLAPAEVVLALGDLQRLRIYAERGFQSPTAVPEEVWALHERLAAGGYDRYVM